MDEQQPSSIATPTTTVIDPNVTDFYRVTIEACFSYWHRIQKEEGSDIDIDAGQVLLTQQFFYILSHLNERVNFNRNNEAAKNKLDAIITNKIAGSGSGGLLKSWY